MSSLVFFAEEPIGLNEQNGDHDDEGGHLLNAAAENGV
jgi:hypothetical protein